MSLDIRLILTITVALVCNSINLGATFSQCHGSFQSYFWVTALFFPITINFDSLKKRKIENMYVKPLVVFTMMAY